MVGPSPTPSFWGLAAARHDHFPGVFLRIESRQRNAQRALALLGKEQGLLKDEPSAVVRGVFWGKWAVHCLLVVVGTHPLLVMGLSPAQGHARFPPGVLHGFRPVASCQNVNKEIALLFGDCSCFHCRNYKSFAGVSNRFKQVALGPLPLPCCWGAFRWESPPGVL